MCLNLRAVRVSKPQFGVQNMDFNELKTLLEEQTRGLEEFKAKQAERVTALEKQLLEAQKKANRPGAPGSSNVIEPGDLPETKGVTVLRGADFKSSAAIADRMGIPADEQPVRIGEFMRAAAGMKTERKGLIEGTDPSGGYTVPSVLMPGILAALAPASSLLRAGANLVHLDETAGEFKVAGIQSIPTPAWRAERGGVAESDPAFRSNSIIPKSLAFYFKVSRELLQDSPGLDSALNAVIGQAFAKEMDRAGLLGSGAGNEPMGLANWAGVNTVAQGDNGTALASFSPFVQAMTAIRTVDGPMPNAAIMAPRTTGDLADLTDTTGQPLRRPQAIESWQFLDTSQIPVDDTVGSSNDCSRLFVGDFSNFSYYLRENLSVMLLKELFATTGEVAFMCHARIDQAIFYPQAFAIVSGVRPAV